MTEKKQRRPGPERRAIKALMAEHNIKYTAALRMIEANPELVKLYVIHH